MRLWQGFSLELSSKRMSLLRAKNQTAREDSCVFEEVRSTLEVIHKFTGICIFCFHQKL